MTDCLLTGVGSSNTQSAVFFFSKRQVSQINSFTSLYSSLRAVTRNTSSPLYHKVTLPEQVGQSRCASTGLENHTRFLKRNVLSDRKSTRLNSSHVKIS